MTEFETPEEFIAWSEDLVKADLQKKMRNLNRFFSKVQHGRVQVSAKTLECDVEKFNANLRLFLGGEGEQYDRHCFRVINGQLCGPTLPDHDKGGEK